MSRRVGEFVDPNTGEQDWLEPDKVDQVVLNPSVISIIGESEEGIVNYKLGNIDEEKVITLTALYETNDDETIESDVQKMDELEFANELAHYIYAGEMVDRGELISAAKAKAFESIVESLFSKGLIVDNTSLEKGFGFVYSGDKKLLTVESIILNRANEDNKKVDVTVSCVGVARLSNLSSPSINHYYGDYEIKIDEIINAKLVTDGSIKTFSFETTPDNISVREVTNDYGTDLSYSNLDISDMDAVDDFISLRRSYLDTEDPNKENKDKMDDLAEILDL